MLKQYGIYMITYKPKIPAWYMSYLRDDSEEHELNIIHHRKEGYASEELTTYRNAVDPISAFTRAANEIIDKIEELNESK